MNTLFYGTSQTATASLLMPNWESLLIGILVVIIIIQFYFYKKKYGVIHKSEKELDLKGNLLQSLIDIIPDTIYYKDRQSKFLVVNKAQANVLGVNEPKDAYGMDDFSFFSHAQVAFDEEQKMMETGVPVINSIITIVNATGERMNLMETKIPVYDDNLRCIGLVGISKDITKLIELQNELIKARDKAEESDRLKSAFLANFSHEVRTPLNAIVGFSELLTIQSLSNEEKMIYNRLIKDANELLLKLIDDILNLSNIEAGNVELNENELNLNEIFHDTVRSHENNLSNEIKLACCVPSDDFICISDRNIIMQIINNLINNAKKFTTSGKIEIGFKLLNDEMIECYVSDTGIGISTEEEQLIFKRFIKINTFQKGNGLGLSICKELVYLLGGEIWVKSEKGVGSVFYFTMKYKAVKKHTHSNQVAD